MSYILTEFPFSFYSKEFLFLLVMGFELGALHLLALYHLSHAPSPYIVFILINNILNSFSTKSSSITKGPFKLCYKVFLQLNLIPKNCF
jgi:hypothetical protein